MAQIDFSNAHIEIGLNSPLHTSYLSLNSANIYDTNGNPINTDNSHKSNVQFTENKEVFRYYGAINSGHSGTEFLIGDAGAWKVTNISFSGGDTYDFTIGASIR